MPFSTLVVVLWTLQLPLYLVQENLEARAFRLPAPGLGAISGIHAAAPLVHLLVALVVAGVVWLIRHRVTILTDDVIQAEARLAGRRRPCHRYCWNRHPERALTPQQRWGHSVWARPPPASRV